MDRVFASIVGIVCTAILLRAASNRRRNPRGLPLPPGPKGLPLIGNFPQTTKESHIWLGYHKLCEKYGDMVYLNLMGQSVLILGSQRRATDLLDIRSSNYSDRPRAIAFEELASMEWNLAFMPYGPLLRRYRRAVHEQFKPAAICRFHPVMYEERDALLRKLRDSPEEFFEHLRIMFGSIILRTAYGQSGVTKRDEFMGYAEGILENTMNLLKPGRYLVNVFPILRHIPSWFPGGSFHHEFRRMKEESQRALNVPFEHALKSNVNRTDASVATYMMDTAHEATDSSFNPEEVEKMTKAVCVMAYVAGADTTYSSALGFIAMLANHPEVQRKAQAEIDAVVGSHRLPSFSDRDALPYVQAVIIELQRWYTVSPIGVIHKSRKDDEYDGYFIPKDTFVLPNQWSILHDPEVFKDPFDFIPERHLKDGKLDPKASDSVLAAFGFGRRICPGRFFSSDNLYLFATSILATFNITCPKCELTGAPTPVQFEVMNTDVAKPLPFKVDISVRSGHEGLIT